MSSHRSKYATTSLIVLLGASACGDDVTVVAPPPAPAIRGVSISPLTATLRPGENLVMVARVDADSAADRSVTWTSADPRRVTVSTNGIATGVSEGFAVITAASRARPEISASASLQVLPAPTVRSISITPGALTMRAGQSVPMVANVVADSAADRTIIWSSADPSRVSVSGTGVVTGLAEGTAVVTATSRAHPNVAGSAAVTVQSAASVRSISLTPATVEITVGNQQPLAVTVVADDGVSRAVTFTSNNSAVATVTAGGLITAVAPGTTTITVSSVASPGINATAIVTVKAPAPPQVSIQSVTQGNTTIPVNLAAAAGQLEVSLNVTAGQDPLARVDLVLSQNGKDTTVASQTFALTDAITSSRAVGSTVPLVLSFRSDMFSPTTGNVSFVNGPASVRAIARSVATPAGASQSASNTVTLTLANVDGFYATMRPLPSNGTASAVDERGRAWVQAGAGLIVRSIPVSFSGRLVGTRTIAWPGQAPVFTLTSTKSGIADDTLRINGYSGPATGPLYVSGEIPAMTAISDLGQTMTVVGTPGTAGAGILNAQPNLVAGAPLGGLRIDNQPPPAGATFVLSTATGNSNNWVNGAYAFASGLTGIVPDAGVGLNGTNAAPTAATAQAQYRAAGQGLTDTLVVLTGADLPASNTHLAYTAVARYFDRLGNTRTVPLTGAAPHPLSTFGVDLVVPTARYFGTVVTGSVPVGLTQITPSGNTVYSALTSGGGTLAYGLEAVDDRAGFGTTSVEVTLTRLTQPNPLSAQTGTTTCVIGVVVQGVCTGAPASLTTILADGYRQMTTALDNGTGVEGYYTWTARIRDQAGNLSAPVTKRVLYDQGTGASAPTLASIGFVPPMLGNARVQFSPSASDNVEIVSGQLHLSYPNLPTTPILAYEGAAAGFFPVGTAFDDTLSSPLLNIAPFSVDKFIRAMEITDGTDAPQAYAAATVKPNGVNAVVRDVPNLTPATLAANTTILSAFVETPAGTPGFINLTGSKALLKWRKFAGGNDPLRMEAVGPSGQTESPFARVILARLEAGVGPNLQVWRILSEVTAASIQDNGIERVWRYDLGRQGAGNYIVIGVSAAGDAICSQVLVL